MDKKVMSLQDLENIGSNCGTVITKYRDGTVPRVAFYGHITERPNSNQTYFELWRFFIFLNELQRKL